MLLLSASSSKFFFSFSFCCVSLCDFDYLKSLIIPFSTFECAFFFKLVISVNRSLGRRKNKISFYDAETEMCPPSRHDFVFHENVFGKQFNSMLDFGAVWKTVQP